MFTTQPKAMAPIRWTLFYSISLCVITLCAAASTFAGRSTDYTYNELRQMTSIDGPRTDVADITYYDYEIATANLLSTT